MKLWLVGREDHVGWDEYQSVVVATETEEEALLYEPSKSNSFGRPEDRTVMYLGEAAEGISGLILDDFNAG